MFTNRRPYYGLKKSTTDFFREPVRYLKESNTQESMMEKPYLEDEYPKMHLKLPDFKHDQYEIPGFIGPIAGGDPYPGLAIVEFGNAKCGWKITNVGYCTEGSVIITMTANYFWSAEFKFVAVVVKDTIGMVLTQLAETKARSWDEQDYMLTFPEGANGSVTICGFASTHTLVSQTFETVVAGMPVGIHVVGGALLPIEKGQDKPATLLKSVYGDKGDDCGCITISSDCPGQCNCLGISIGYSTQSMGPSEEQTLTALGAVDDCYYEWEKFEGGGSLSGSSGASVIYTAPSENPNCADNAIITLSVNSVLCDSLSIAINMPDQTGPAYLDYSESVVCTGGYCKKYVGHYTCLDFRSSRTFESCVYGGWIECGEVADCGGCETGVIDIRTDAQKAAGCCPAGLL